VPAYVRHRFSLLHPHVQLARHGHTFAAVAAASTTTACLLQRTPGSHRCRVRLQHTTSCDDLTCCQRRSSHDACTVTRGSPVDDKACGHHGEFTVEHALGCVGTSAQTHWRRHRSCGALRSPQHTPIAVCINRHPSRSSCPRHHADTDDYAMTTESLLRKPKRQHHRH
jgi:hypothetical protein